ncbi:Glu/Leu/Phe/Val dehydrogenase [bacterium]|jgi:glutamate dehydrogenase/leucine dehydrogenase|nr:Glu/Leu/Phe/Val dehydrogenase [bacterium]
MQIKDVIDTKHKKLIFKQHGDAKMILAYHTMRNGTCFGGIRLLPHGAGAKGVKDALRLSEAMTYKLALIGSPYGGCKAVVFLPKEGKSDKFLRDIGVLVEEEQGKFIAAIDFGFEPKDAITIRETTEYIFAIVGSEFGQSGVTTAHGVMKGIRASLNHAYDSDEIAGKSFVVQGLGSVGVVVARELIKEGGNVSVCDLDKQKLEEFVGVATIVPPEKFLDLDVDVLVPCGPAYILNKETIPKLKSKIIAGGANCLLEDEVSDDALLHKSGVLVAPDYVINAGGVMQGIEELIGGSTEDAVNKLSIITRNLEIIYKRSKEEGRGTYSIAKEMAIEKIAE